MRNLLWGSFFVSIKMVWNLVLCRFLFSLKRGLLHSYSFDLKLKSSLSEKKFIHFLYFPQVKYIASNNKTVCRTKKITTNFSIMESSSLHTHSQAYTCFKLTDAHLHAIQLIHITCFKMFMQ